MALGANARDIVVLVMKRGLWQIAIGLVLGLGAAFPVSRLMASMPIGAPASDPALLVIVCALMAGVGLFACWLPARRAAALDPVKAIRCE
jgi:ABC-type antimicrobial peptide transport system permease subunit